MLEILAKRLSFFGQILIIVTIVSIIFWIQKIESHDLRNDLLNLNMIETLKTKSPAKILNFEDEYILNIKNFTDEIFSVPKNEKVRDQVSEVRRQVTKWIEEQLSNSRATNIDLVEEPFLIAGSGGIPNLFSPGIYQPRYQRNSQNITYSFIEFLSNDFKDKDYRTKNSIQTVSELLDKLNFLGSFNKIAVSTKIKKPLPEIKKLLGEQRNNYYLEKIWLSESTLKVKFLEDLMPMVQRRPFTKIIEIPVETQEIQSLSLLSISNPEKEEDEQLKQLFSDKYKKKFLQETYGMLPIEEAKKIVSDGLAQAYQKIDILGFSISTRRFPLAVLFSCMISIGGSFITINYAKKHSLKIISQVNEENPIDILIDNWLSRILLWCVLPVVAITLSLPAISIPLVELITVYIGGMVVFILGVLTTVKSRNL